MSIKLFDDYISHRPGGVAPGGNNYGTLLSIYGRINHWEHNLYFGANKKLYFRTSTWTGGTAEGGITGGFNEWRTILDSKSDIESSGNLKLTGSGDNYILYGNVGIGTDNPTQKLHVNGIINTYTGDPLSHSYSWGLDLTEENSPNNRKAYVIQRHKGLSFSAHSYYGGIRFYNQESASPYGYNGIMVMSITNGNVGIGTENPTYKLSVKGTIGCSEVKVEDVSGWADFVFEPGYNLRSLGELETFIQQNRHLPEIPTETEVKQNGISVGEMNAKLLQKIEELTLYVIEMKKENEAQSNEIRELKKMIK